MHSRSFVAPVAMAFLLVATLFGPAVGTVAAAGFAISGAITSGGTPLAGVVVRALDDTNAVVATAPVTDVSGAFEVAGLANDASYILEVVAPATYQGGYVSSGTVTGDITFAEPIFLSGGDQTGVAVDLARVFRISGTVEGEGGFSVAGSTVAACDEIAGCFFAGAIATDGSYAIDVPEVGTYSIQIEGPAPAISGGFYATGPGSWSNDYADVILVPVSGDITIPLVTLPVGHTLSGTIRTVGTLAPIGDALISLETPLGLEVAPTTTAVDGSFSLTDVRTGSYKLEAWSGVGYLGAWYSIAGVNHTATTLATASLIVVAASPTTVTVPDMSLIGTYSITGLLLDTDDVPVPFTPIDVLNGDNSLIDTVYTAEDGAFNVGDLLPGQYRLHINSGGSAGQIADGWYSSTATSEFTESAPSAGVITITTANAALGTIKATRRYSISGIVSGSFAAPNVLTEACEVATAACASDTTGADGSFNITGLTPGTYVLAFTVADGVRLGDGYYRAATTTTHFTSSASDATRIVVVADVTTLPTTLPQEWMVSGTVNLGGAYAFVELVNPVGDTLDSVYTPGAFGFIALPGAYTVRVNTDDTRFVSPTWYQSTAPQHLGTIASTITIGAADVPLGTLIPPLVVLDSTPPAVSVTSPAAGASGVARASTMTVTFSETVTGVTGTTIRLYDVTAGAVLPAGVAYGSKVATIVPSALLPASHVVQIQILAGIKDVAGNALAPKNVQFTVVGDPLPIVSLTSPAAGATGVARNAKPTVTFSEAVTGVSGTTIHLFDATANVVLPAGITYATNVATIAPSALLPTGHVVQVQILAGIKDLTANPLAAKTVSFTVSTDVPPVISATSPAASATGIARNAIATATFSEDVTGVSGTTIRIYDANTKLYLAAGVTYASKVATIRPSALLPAGHVVQIQILAGIKDLTANPLAVKTVSFTVTTDATSPKISTRTPASKKTGVSRTANLTITFTENVKGASATTIRLKDTKTGKYIKVVVTYSATARRATINPSIKLSSKRKYLVLVSSGIKDYAGNSTATTSWYFTTRR